MGKIYANLKNITDGNKDWGSLDKHVDTKVYLENLKKKLCD